MTAWTLIDGAADQDVLPLLERDAAWATYALCDLEPPFREHTRLIAAVTDGNVRALVLLHHLLGSTALLPFGSAAGVLAILDAGMPLPRSALVIMPLEVRTAIERRYRLSAIQMMWRMRATTAELNLAPKVALPIQRLTSEDFADAAAVLRQSPSSYFSTTMLAHGVYYGVRQERRLIAVAGTHVVSHRRHIAAIGNVYTDPKWRARGLATGVTSAVAQDLAAMGIAEIVLNVRQDNRAAIAAYRRLGFTMHLPFYEAVGALRCETIA